MAKGIMLVISDALIQNLVFWFSYIFYLVASLLYVVFDLFAGTVFKSGKHLFCFVCQRIALQNVIELASSCVQTSQC